MSAVQNTQTPTDYTSGSIRKAILRMGLPSMLGFGATHIYAMVDTWWVAQLPDSESAVAGLTIFANILWFLGSINMMVGAGSVAMISRRYGEKNYQETEWTIKETFLLKFIVGLIIGALGLFFIEELVALVGGRGESLRYAVEYGEVMFWAMPIAFVMFSVWTALRSVSNPKIAMALMFGSTALNIILDPLLIFGYWGFPEMGIQGAAVASVVAYIFVVVIGLILFATGKTNVRLHIFRNTNLRLRSMWQMVRIGAPAWVAGASDSGVRLAVIPLLASYGEAVVAAYGVTLQVAGLGLVLIVGAGLGISSLLGQTLGAGRMDRAKTIGDTGIFISAGMMGLYGLLVFLFSESIAGLYFKNPETIALSSELLRIFSIGFPFWGVWVFLESLYSGVGLNKPSMVFSVTHAWVLRAPMAYVLVILIETGPTEVWYGLMMTSVITAVAFYAYYRRGQWLKVKV
ncbi:MATE family efflux transporter [Gemmatimonas aurantiaca]|nr:MATE family efflux transporter [Gemmatimonas aurantiaca]